MHEEVKHPVFYASKKIIPREQNYSIGERKALAIIIKLKSSMVILWTTFHA